MWSKWESMRNVLYYLTPMHIVGLSEVCELNRPAQYIYLMNIIAFGDWSLSILCLLLVTSQSSTFVGIWTMEKAFGYTIAASDVCHKFAWFVGKVSLAWHAILAIVLSSIRCRITNSSSFSPKVFLWQAMAGRLFLETVLKRQHISNGAFFLMHQWSWRMPNVDSVHTQLLRQIGHWFTRDALAPF